MQRQIVSLFLNIPKIVSARLALEIKLISPLHRLDGFVFFIIIFFFYQKPDHFKESSFFKMDTDLLKFIVCFHKSSLMQLMIVLFAFLLKTSFGKSQRDTSVDKNPRLNSESCSFHYTPFPWEVDDAQRCLNSRCFMEGNVEYVGREMTVCRKVPVKIFSSCLHHISVYQPCFFFSSTSAE